MLSWFCPKAYSKTHSRLMFILALHGNRTSYCLSVSVVSSKKAKVSLNCILEQIAVQCKTPMYNFCISFLFVTHQVMFVTHQATSSFGRYSNDQICQRGRRRLIHYFYPIHISIFRFFPHSLLHLSQIYDIYVVPLFLWGMFLTWWTWGGSLIHRLFRFRRICGVGNYMGIPALQVNDNFLSSAAIVTTQLLRRSIAGHHLYYVILSYGFL